MISAERGRLGAIAAVVAVAAGLRVWGLGFGLPDLFHQDEPILVQHALAIGAGGWNPRFFILPPFCMYSLFGLFAAGYGVLRAAGAVADPAAYAALFLNDPSGFYLAARLFLGVFFGAATVWMVAVRAKTVVSSSSALVASLFLALMPLHVRHSHYAYTDAAVTFALTLYWFELLRLARGEGGRGAYARAGAALGWAVSIKYTAAYVSPVFLAAWLIRERGRMRSGRPWSGALAFAAAGAGVFALIAPYTFLDWTTFWEQIRHQAGAESALPVFHHLRYSLAGGAGPAFLILAGAGMAALFGVRRSEAWVTAAFVALFYAVNTAFGQPYARYALPLAPVLCVLAVRAVESFFGPRGLVPQALAVFLVLLFMVPVSIQSDRLFAAADTRTQCREWFEKNVPESAVVVSSRTFGPRLRQTAEQIAGKAQALGNTPADKIRRLRLDLEARVADGKKTYRVYVLESPFKGTPFLSEQPQIPPTAGAVRASGASHLVVNFSEPGPGMDRLLADLEPSIEKAAVFSPYRDPERRTSVDPYGATAAPDLPAELFARKGLGPYLAVYRLRSEQSS